MQHQDDEGILPLEPGDDSSVPEGRAERFLGGFFQVPAKFIPHAALE
jgi:hypothetical protein